MSTFHPIAWTSDLQFGVPEIDDEHALLVTLYNDVVRATNQGVSRPTRDGIMGSLRAYAIFPGGQGRLPARPDTVQGALLRNLTDRFRIHETTTVSVTSRGVVGKVPL